MWEIKEMAVDLSRMIQVTPFGPDTTYYTVLSLVQPFSPSPHIRIPTEPSSGKAAGSVFITFDSYLQANTARRGINGAKLEGKVLFARLVVPFPQLEAANVFVNSLPLTLTPAQLEDLCPASSIILSSRISTDYSGNSQGYGYIQFLTEDMANSAIAQLNSVYIQHRPLSAQPFLPKSKRILPCGHTVFLLNCSLKEAQVRKVFETYGEVRDVLIRKKAAAVVTTVTMTSRESAVEAVKEVDGRPWACSLRPYVGY